MNRNQFIRRGLLAGGTALLSGISAARALNSKTFADSSLTNRPAAGQDAELPFTLKFSPDFTVFNHDADMDPVDQLKWGYDQGFRAWENTWLKRRPAIEQERISRAIRQLGMEFGQFVGTASMREVTFAGNDKSAREQVLQEVRKSVDIAKRMNTRFVHNVLDMADPRLPMGFQMTNAIELLKRVAEIYEPHGIVMVMETMNHKINHPGLFLHTIPQAYALAKAVDSPSVKILFDVYHVQIQEGNLIPTLDYAWDEIAYIQVGDTPGRKEPGTGEINYKNLLQHIYDKGYRGFVGMEHKLSKPGEAGNKAALEAYRAVDPEV